MENFWDYATKPLFFTVSTLVATVLIMGTIFNVYRWYQSRRKMPVCVAFVLATLSLLTLCANPLGNMLLLGRFAESAYAAMMDRVQNCNGFVGCTETTLLEELGEPQHRYTKDGQKAWKYAPGPSWCLARMDTITFVLEDGVVNSWYCDVF